MRRWAAMVALSLALGAAISAWAGDWEDCFPSLAHSTAEPPATTGATATDFDKFLDYLRDTPNAAMIAACSRLAGHGDPLAQDKLGDMYHHGAGGLVRLDHTEAATWYRKAADRGDRLAQLALGKMYSTGDGLPKDYIAAYMWLNLARGWKDPAEGRESVAELMTPSQIDQAQALSAGWKPKKAGSP